MNGITSTIQKTFMAAAIVALAVGTSACARTEKWQPADKVFSAGESIGGTWRAQAVGKPIVQDEVSTKPAIHLIGRKDLNDYSIFARVQIKDPKYRSEAGLVFQYRDDSNYLAFTLVQRKRGPYAVLRIQTDATLHEVVGDQSWQKNLDLTEWNELRVDFHGAEAVGYVNGREAASFCFEGTPPEYNSHGKTWEIDPTEGRAGLYSIGCAAKYKDIVVKPLKDFSHIITPQKGKRDAGGMLLPRQSYAESMRRFSEWMLHSGEIVDTTVSKARDNQGEGVVVIRKANIPEAIQSLPPYLLTNFVAADDDIWAAGGEFAFNHSLLITGSVEYAHFSGDQRYLEIARNVADWHLVNRTPADWAFPHAPPSVVSFRDDGSWEGQDWGLEVDKSSYMGLAYLKLYAATGEKKYLDAANDIAGTLRKYQVADGSWPFRVNAQTGEVQQGYACSQLWHVWFFERLALVNGSKEDRERSRRAFQWLLDNPVKTNKWMGLYGDIASGAESYDQWVALETIMYILDRRDEIPGALETCKNLFRWLEENLIVDYGFHPDVPGVLEQSQYKIVLTHHQLRLAEVYAKFYEATGDPAYKKKAIETANSVTWCQMSDGKIRQGFWYHAVASPLILSFNEQYCRIMACIPETAPPDENHLLTYTGLIRNVSYDTDRVSYRTLGAGAEQLKLVSRPKHVDGAGEEVSSRKELASVKEGWYWNEDGGTLDVRHKGEQIKIKM